MLSLSILKIHKIITISNNNLSVSPVGKDTKYNNKTQIENYNSL